MGRYTAIVVPAYNENRTIAEAIQPLKIFGDVIVVDDGSIDQTAITAYKSGSRVLSHKTNLGYEMALSTGVEYAVNNGYKYIITTDADGELKSEGIAKIKNSLENNFEIVLGNRESKNRYIEIIFGKLCSYFFDLNDPLCGMKGYSSKIIQKFGSFDTKKMIGTEILAHALRENVEIKEVKVDVKKREGASRYGSSISSFFKISRVVFLFFKISIMKSN